MPIEAELREPDMMESHITVAPLNAVGLDGGGRGYAAPVTIQCHAEIKRRLVRTATGEERTAEGRFLLDDAYLWINDLVRLTDPQGNIRPVIAVETTYGLNLDTDETGPYQTIIYFT